MVCAFVIMITRLFVTVSALSLIGVCVGEMFTSLAHLEQILYTERDLGHDLNQYIASEQARLDKLRGVAKDFLRHSEKALEQKDTYFASPVNAYLLLKRFTLEWAEIKAKYIDSNAYSFIIDKLEERKNTLPGTEDLGGAISALLRLQDTYGITAQKFADGEFLGNGSTIESPKMSALDCFIFGQDAYNREDYYHAILWLEESLKRSENGDSHSPPKSSIIDYLAFAVFKQGDIDRAHKLTLDLLKIEPHHERAKANLEYFKHALSTTSASNKYMTMEEFKTHGMGYKTSQEYELYEKLCRGEDTVKHKRDLSCRLVTNNHPLLILQPVKEETIHEKPWIAMYHEVIPDSYIKRIKELAAPRLGRATVQNPVTGVLEFADYRISKSAWLKNHHDPVVEKTCNIIEAVTNLTVSTAEELQVANYGLGGHYEPHFDYARRHETDSFKSLGTGNRIATWLLYMSDVHAGGATVFPYIGVKIFPKKGTAAFWHNLHRSGEGDELTRHAACPVLAGTKWVSNKWIHERGQEFRRRCALHPNL